MHSKPSCKQELSQEAPVLRPAPSGEMLSTRGDVVSQIWQEGDDFLLQDLGWGATGTWWVEAKEVAQILQCTGQPSQQRILESSVNSVEVGKPWPGDSV